MRFWDSSAVVPLLVEEEVSDFLAQQAQEDPHLIVWCCLLYTSPSPRDRG